MREIVFDTETTGFDPSSGDRLVEIGAVEIENYVPTGRVYHQYVNPERDMPEGAFKVHGLSTEFLSGQPLFADVCRDFVAFVGDAKLVAHNAEFDIKFIDWELRRVGLPAYGLPRAVDTLAIARRKFPGAPCSLDALCKRFDVDLSGRTFHGALLDAQLLAKVYLELMGGRQQTLILAGDRARRAGDRAAGPRRERPTPLPSLVTEAEAAAHEAFVAKLGDGAVWRKVEAAPVRAAE